MRQSDYNFLKRWAGVEPEEADMMDETELEMAFKDAALNYQGDMEKGQIHGED